MEILSALDYNIITYIFNSIVRESIMTGALMCAVPSLIGLGAYKAICLIDIKH